MRFAHERCQGPAQQDTHSCAPLVGRMKWRKIRMISHNEIDYKVAQPVSKQQSWLRSLFTVAPIDSSLTKVSAVEIGGQLTGHMAEKGM